MNENKIGFDGIPIALLSKVECLEVKLRENGSSFKIDKTDWTKLEYQKHCILLERFVTTL